MKPIWYLISDEARSRIKDVMPKNWRPPRENNPSMKLDSKVETDIKVEKLARANASIAIR